MGAPFFVVLPDIRASCGSHGSVCSEPLNESSVAIK